MSHECGHGRLSKAYMKEKRNLYPTSAINIHPLEYYADPSSYINIYLYIDEHLNITTTIQIIFNVTCKASNFPFMLGSVAHSKN